MENTGSGCFGGLTLGANDAAVHQLNRLACVVSDGLGAPAAYLADGDLAYPDRACDLDLRQAAIQDFFEHDFYIHAPSIATAMSSCNSPRFGNPREHCTRTNNHRSCEVDHTNGERRKTQ